MREEDQRNSIEKEKEKERSQGRKMEREFGEIENEIREKVGRRKERTGNAELEKFKRRGRGKAKLRMVEFKRERDGFREKVRRKIGGRE